MLLRHCTRSISIFRSCVQNNTIIFYRLFTGVWYAVRYITSREIQIRKWGYISFLKVLFSIYVVINRLFSLWRSEKDVENRVDLYRTLQTIYEMWILDYQEQLIEISKVEAAAYLLVR